MCSTRPDPTRYLLKSPPPPPPYAYSGPLVDNAMNRDEANALLRNRSALTSQPYSADVADVWAEALAPWTYMDARAAMLSAARDLKKITVADIVDRLPKRAIPATVHRVHCDLCDGTGTVEAPYERAHIARYCKATTRDDCRCHALEACRCTAGQTMAPVLARIIDAPDRPVQR